MAHEELKERLEQGLRTLALNLADAAEIENVRGIYNTEAKIYHELTIRYATGEITHRGAERMEHFRFDSVVFVRPGIAGLNRNQCFTVGVEIKGHLNDLQADDKIMYYLGWTDFFYIAVPKNLIRDAVKKAAIDDRIGVIDIDTDRIIKIPVRQNITLENRLKIYEQVVYSQPFEVCSGTVNDHEADNAHLIAQEAENTNEGIKYKPVSVSRIMEQYDGTDAMMKEILRNVNATANVYANAKEEERENSHIEDIENTNRSNISVDENNISFFDMISKKQQLEANRKVREEERQKLAVEVANKAGELPEPTRVKLSTLSDKAQAAYHEIRKNPDIKSLELEQSLGVSQATAQRLVIDLRQSGLIERVGSRKTGGYRVTEMDIDKPSYLKHCSACNLYRDALTKGHLLENKGNGMKYEFNGSGDYGED